MNASLFRILPALSFSVAVLIAFAAMPAKSLAQTEIQGIVPLPDSPPAAVMAKRYNIVSRGGALSTMPPVSVVWLEGSFSAPAKPRETVSIAQKNFEFEPALLPIRIGTTVSFPNLDSEYHNVFSYSKSKRFDLGRYMPNETPVPTETFDQAGAVVLRCDIHEHMKAIIIVVDSPFYMTTDTAGHFHLSDVPPGTYTVKAWVNTKTTLARPIVIKPDQRALNVDFQ